MSEGKVIRHDFGGAISVPSKGYGSIQVYLRKDGSFGYRHRGSLSHIEKIGMLTMALHSMEYLAMNGGSDE